MKQKKLFKIILTFIIVITVFISCSHEDAGNASNNLKNIEKGRMIFTGKDSLFLFPYEIFGIMTIEEINKVGLYGTITLKDELSNTTVEFPDFLNNYAFDDKFKDEHWVGRKVTFNLKTIENDLIREIMRDEKYKVIFSYHSDSEVLRTNIPTEYHSGYYIVDIVGINDKFQREIQYGLNAPIYIQDGSTMQNSIVRLNYNENIEGNRPNLSIEYLDGFDYFENVMPVCFGDYCWCLRNKDNEDIAYLKIDFNSNNSRMSVKIKYDELIEKQPNKEELKNHIKMLEGTFVR
jgi:hypothetical protein